MRRHQQLRQRAAFYPTPFDSFPGGIENFARKHRVLRPGLFLQLALLALLAAFFPGAKLHAQTGSITGTVVDPSGAAIPGAKVQVTDQATGNLTREAGADAGGTFRALNLPPGTYRIKVSAPGMEELVRDGVVLDQDQTLGLGQVALTVGQASQTVTVTTQTPLIDTATSSNAAVVDQRQVTEQPLNGRDFES
ncbi:MAG TPA: carboxypeptidase-like regulatory domain-containing protein, partial [Acidobacteriaceae bacterium]|nr:carboxypeptidase-like regulatory domain-containing protein [Acidobacteriaceae bacterium]